MRSRSPLPAPGSGPARQETCLDRLSPGKESRDQRPERVSEPQHWLLSLPLGLAEGLTPSVPAAQPQRLSRPLGAQGPSLIPFQDEPWLWGEKLVSGGAGQGSPTPSHGSICPAPLPLCLHPPLALIFLLFPTPRAARFLPFYSFWLYSVLPGCLARFCCPKPAHTVVPLWEQPLGSLPTKSPVPPQG